MSSYDRTAPRRLLLLASLFGLSVLAAGCTVRPLYSTASVNGRLVGEQARLASIGIKPVDTRFGQKVRNQLVFLLGGGAGEPASPAYELALDISSKTSSAAYQAANSLDNAGVATAGTVTMTASYTLTDTATTKAVATGKRSVMASFDRPQQQYATVRAERDAQDRAARELAEELHLAIAQDLSH